ncbi:anti-sigma-F factor Fin [Lentibacillus sediminis]|uniref:anti-sigma-F factor Fin n=1 Tax=Lentibacillus sediminis TaxID=1940529 RepID=UPI000C1C6105|nr:anti-sigma-F factor Fin family protein [Lentibacillus sediminis]
MSLIYTCRHCGHEIGKLDEPVIDTSMLGFDQLSSEDREQMIQYLENGDMEIQIICEDCQETLKSNPQYHELDFFIQ